MKERILLDESEQYFSGAPALICAENFDRKQIRRLVPSNRPTGCPLEGLNRPDFKFPGSNNATFKRVVH